jgi:hypothetical protein
MKIKLFQPVLAGLCFAIAVLFTAAFSYSQETETLAPADTRSSTETVINKTDDGILYGREISTYERIIPVKELVNAAEKYDGNTLVVRGEITDVCQAMGCWLVISSGANIIRVKTNHEYFVPGDIVGKIAVIEGVFKVAELTEEEANHYNEESLNKTEEIKSPVLALEIEATGIVVLNDEIMESKPVE